MSFRSAAAALVSLALAPAVASAADGAELYATHCAKCHGSAGGADTPVAKAMNVPALAGKTFSAEQLGEIVNGNAKHKALHGKLSEEELQAIAELIATFTL